MIFKRNKPSATPPPSPRGRDSVQAENPLAARLRAEDEPDTIDLQAQGTGSSPAEEPAEPATRRLDGAAATAEEEREEAPEEAPEDRLISGVLAVLSGPQRGTLLHLLYGDNVLALDDRHQVIITGPGLTAAERIGSIHYDAASRQFTLHPGSPGTALMMAGSELTFPVKLQSGARFDCGEHRLRFVAVCGDDFDW